MASSANLPKSSATNGKGAPLANAAGDGLLRATARAGLEAAIKAVSSVILGKEETVRLLMAAVLARGHVLIEDIPGVGKTTLARAVARVLGCSFSRIQFTADMLPSDVVGVHVLDQRSGDFAFKRGPIYAHVVLADEINRASPKTQSAMLEAMSERQVTVDESSFALPEVFTVMATQNPVEYHGAYPLPESQLDRFMLRIEVGYPPRQDERSLIDEPSRPQDRLSELRPVLNVNQLLAAQKQVAQVQLSPAVADYILAIVEATRRHTEIMLGCSPRGSAAFAAVVRAWAYLKGRDFVLPDDVKELACPVLLHRLLLCGSDHGASARHQTRILVDEVLAKMPVPR